MKKAVLCFALLIGLAVVGVAQLPTVTNETLEKYKRERLAALREYRENYARMGFPSPEELDRQHREEVAREALRIASEICFPLLELG